jgi:hypothetical protein
MPPAPQKKSTAFSCPTGGFSAKVIKYNARQSVQNRYRKSTYEAPAIENTLHSFLASKADEGLAKSDQSPDQTARKWRLGPFLGASETTPASLKRNQLPKAYILNARSATARFVQPDCASAGATPAADRKLSAGRV